MGCGCRGSNGNNNRSAIQPSRTVRPQATPMNPPVLPNQLRSPVQPNAGVTSEMRKMQAIRRDAIRKNLNK